MIRMKTWVNPRVKELGEMLPNKRDMESIVRDMDKTFRKQELRIFATEGGGGAGKWQPLSEQYSRRKKKLRPGRKILTWSGKLRNSLTRKSGSAHITNVFQSGFTWRLQVGTRNPLAAYHEEGGTHLPRRSFMDRSRKQEDALIVVVQKGVARVASRYMRAAAAYGSVK